MNFGTELRRWRRDADLTLAKVSEAVGMSIVHVSQIERGSKNPPTPEVLRKWLKSLGKEDQYEEMLFKSTRARKSLKISLAGHSETVVDMAGSLARQVEGGELDDDTAEKISLLLNRRKQKNDDTRSNS